MPDRNTARHADRFAASCASRRTLENYFVADDTLSETAR